MLRTNNEFLSYIKELYSDDAYTRYIKVQQLAVDTQFLTQGERVHQIYIIKEGIAKCFFSEENGKDYILEFLGKGEILGEIEAIREMPCLCNVAAVTTLEVYSISIKLFNDLMDKEMRLNKLLLKELAERMVNTSSKASFQQLYTVEHGLAKLLELRDKQQLQLSKEDMAAYLGITLRSLNRALKGFSHH